MLDRLPSIPLLVSDPYFSIWCPGDKLTDADTVHWAGASKTIRGSLNVDGHAFRFLGASSSDEMTTTSLKVTPTTTLACYEAAGVSLTLRFTSPALPEDLDLLSTPITFVDMTLSSADGKAHQARLTLDLSDSLCYDGTVHPNMFQDTYALGNLNVAFTGQLQQKPLSHSGDKITIDWGYLYLASDAPVSCGAASLQMKWEGEVTAEGHTIRSLAGYDDIFSIFYFGHACRAWYTRNGKTLPQALEEFAARHDEILAACDALDAQVLSEARASGGEDYASLCSASWRQVMAAHKLIAAPNGKPAFLSKENASNGCIGTVDVSYPSVPLFLRYNPELVFAMCRPVLEFSHMPVWGEDFAPHDVGRYPFVCGQVYGADVRTTAAQRMCGATVPPYYLYPAGSKVYEDQYQMPVEECGNMLIMLYAAAKASGETQLLREEKDLLAKWVRYLDQYGENPGNQLCTDDFAGHLAQNVNLSAKAIVGVMCYARILGLLGEDGSHWEARAHEMAKNWLDRTHNPEGTPLTFDGQGWSMKYNLVWDLLLDLGLLDKSFYAQETRSYLPRINTYGLPLDSRSAYTKSDWILWVSAMAQDMETRRALIAPVARFLKESYTRIPFGDWYDTVTGRYISFIARSVQGGLYMPLLLDAWKK